MSNIANIQKLHYCNKKNGNRCKCANIATHQIIMKKKGDENSIIAKQEHGYRCEKHANTGTANKKVVESLPYDQSYSLTSINKYLHSLINKEIVSKIHIGKKLRVKYKDSKDIAIVAKRII